MFWLRTGICILLHEKLLYQSGPVCALIIVKFSASVMGCSTQDGHQTCGTSGEQTSIGAEEHRDAQPNHHLQRAHNTQCV